MMGELNGGDVEAFFCGRLVIYCAKEHQQVFDVLCDDGWSLIRERLTRRTFSGEIGVVSNAAAKDCAYGYG